MLSKLNIFQLKYRNILKIFKNKRSYGELKAKKPEGSCSQVNK